MKLKRIILIILSTLLLLIGFSIVRIIKRTPINIINLGFEINLPEPDSYLYSKSNRSMHGDGELVIISEYSEEGVNLKGFDISTAEEVAKVIDKAIYFDESEKTEILNEFDLFSPECEHYSYHYDDKSLYISYNRQSDTYLTIALYF